MRMDVSSVGLWSEAEIEDSAEVFVSKELISRQETKQGSSLQEKNKHGSRSEKMDSCCPFMLSTDNRSSRRLLKLSEINRRCHYHHPRSHADTSSTLVGFTSAVSLPLKLGSKRLQPGLIAGQSETTSLSPWTTWEYPGRHRCYVSDGGCGVADRHRRQVTLMQVMTPRQQQQHALVRTGDKRRPWEALWKNNRPSDISYSFQHFSDIRRYMEQYRREHTYKTTDDPKPKEAESKQMFLSAPAPPAPPPLFVFPPPLDQSLNQSCRSSYTKHHVIRLSYHHLAFEMTPSHSSSPRNRKTAEGARLESTQLPQLTVENVVNEEEVEVVSGGRGTCVIGDPMCIANCAGTKLTKSLSLLPKCSYRLHRRRSYQLQQKQQQQLLQQQQQQQQKPQQQHQPQPQQQLQPQQHQQRHLQPDFFAIQKNANAAFRDKNPKVIITTAASSRSSFSKARNPLCSTTATDGTTVVAPSATSFLSADVIVSPFSVSPATVNPLSLSSSTKSPTDTAPSPAAAASVAAAGGDSRRKLKLFPRTTFITISDLDLSVNLTSTCKQPLQLFRHTCTSTPEGISAKGQGPPQLKHPTNLCRTTAIGGKTHAL